MVMITLRPSDERGHRNYDWLDTYHTFSFADYYDPRYAGFRALRVINEDRVKPGEGFGTHPHNNMEIITYVIEGQLEHKDSMGHGRIVNAGEVQGMSAGTGITHSEFNPSDKSLAHFLQIWIVPDKKGLGPSYSEWAPKGKAKRNQMIPIASPDGAGGSVTIHQDAAAYLLHLKQKTELKHEIGAGRHAWVQLVSGRVDLGGTVMKAGDGAAVSEERSLVLRGIEDSELLVFDLT